MLSWEVRGVRLALRACARVWYLVCAGALVCGESRWHSATCGTVVTRSVLCGGQVLAHACSGRHPAAEAWRSSVHVCGGCGSSQRWRWRRGCWSWTRRSRGTHCGTAVLRRGVGAGWHRWHRQVRHACDSASPGRCGCAWFKVRVCLRVCVCVCVLCVCVCVCVCVEGSGGGVGGGGGGACMHAGAHMGL